MQNTVCLQYLLCDLACWWSKIENHYIFKLHLQILKLDFLEYLMLNDILKGMVKICCQMKEWEKRILSFWNDIHSWALHYRSFQWQQSYCKQTVLHNIKNCYLMVTSQEEQASLMPSYNFKPMKTKLKCLNKKCSLNSRDKVKELSWMMTLKFN